jgi:Flp pilus assembly protein TadG
MDNNSAQTKLTLAHDESGAVAIVVALIFTTLCGFVALAVDIGHIVRVKAELQRTADAAALAGAMGLAPYTGPLTNQTPDWSQGQKKALAIINNAANEADNQIFTLTLNDSLPVTGYWLLNPPQGYVQPPLPAARPTTAAYLPEPGIQVTLSRNVSLYFAPLVGISSPKTVSAAAIAILPEAYSTKNPAPIAVSKDTVTNLVDTNVVIDTSDQGIKVNSNNGAAGWYNMTGENDVGAIQNTLLPVGTTQIYMMPGAMATAMGGAGTTIVVPVVQTVDQKTWPAIIGFAGFRIDSISGPTMTGRFVSVYFDANALPTPGDGNNLYGVSGTPKLVSP